ncbi:uncharacterized protein LOC111744283 isoform X4 [Pteropus vampyrus]|uniref:Uncharacterized protein LOC111744283 isoform X4 n=1 Tax=Pteropus vampyrus TaxID=132908 RepID=A0A6P6CSZ7_PTEVA|nr:uncharacterized protein LOC111744283 isoform X4 [Pteropus vampyrus]XP_023390529.1 uncharacterized protein LOC111744283 isoform X4 [Pteropus vampyrus]
MQSAFFPEAWRRPAGHPGGLSSWKGGNRGPDADRTCPWERLLPLAGRDRTLGVTPVTQPLCRDALQGRRGSFPMSSCPPSGTDLSNSQQLMLGYREVPFRLATPRPSTGTFRDHPKRSGWHLLIAEKNHQDLRCQLLQLHRVIKYSQTQTPEQKGNNRRERGPDSERRRSQREP